MSTSPWANKMQRSLHTIMLKLHTHIFPVSRQHVNDSGATPISEALFESKTRTAIINHYNTTTTTTKKTNTINWCAREVTSQKFKRLERLFELNVVDHCSHIVVETSEAFHDDVHCDLIISICILYWMIWGDKIPRFTKLPKDFSW